MNSRNGSYITYLLFKNPYILAFFLLLVFTFGLMSIFFFADAGSKDNSQDNNMGNGSYMCTEGQVNEGVYMKAFEKAGVFTGKGKDFIQIARKNNIDPVLLTAIAFHETGRGTSNAVKNKNNPGGIMGKGGLRTFSTLDEGLDYMAGNLFRLYISQGLVTIPQIGNKYAPVGASNDPTNLNIHWVPIVTNMTNELGGLSMNCQAVGQGSGGVVIDGSGNQIFDPNVVYNSMAKFLGQAYVWGGASPTGFDCSGLMQWNFRQTVGINLPRTAEEQYHATARVSKEQLKAGDLIFFTGTYVGKTVTHVGMYIGNGKMINSNNSGVKIDDVFSPYWGKYYYGAGRITHK
ncbi:TPA: NlpC/P60 family protein [Bacillus thuringiensis]|uniref:Conjugal transfer protein n=7 Tax=Bacillus cereus group TaxID=86661 RepID=A0A9X0KEY2_BACCE|nr:MULTISPECIES: NlpC/P60 family protein [Bacillus]ACI30582.1 hypothetical conjugation protein [Bacillus cereus H3081.97]AKR38740.1 Protein TrsG [Bacillus thuringiensis serovar indiana]EOP80566.1 hypothetical protein IES_06352 [Bacillus cereus BMG1.7]OTY74355.1 conjugal transfer protein [Bacillus thuringiensis serovar canadensis]AGE81575.1 TrsG protein [Bacillus thuringiensis serovar kurstaki str. HD73]